MDDDQRQNECRAAAAQIAADAVTACGKLSPREREVLLLTAKGLSQKEIALALNLTLWTIMAYRKSIHRKRDVETAIEAAVMATKAGII